MKTIAGFEANPIGIGTWGMGGSMQPDQSNDKTHVLAIEYSIEQGQNHIDTAEMYGGGHTEELISSAIKKFDRDKLFIASKLWQTHAKPDQAVNGVKGMLKRLETDYLDLLYIHWPWPGNSISEYMKSLDSAVDAGLVRSVGVSNFNLKQLKEAVTSCRHPIAAIQNHYNLLYRDEVSDDMLAYCQENNISVVAYRPVERGQLSSNETIEAIASKHNATPSQIALAWLIRQPGVHAIPKASNHQHIAENIGALNIRMSDEEFNQLSALA